MRRACRVLCLVLAALLAPSCQCERQRRVAAPAPVLNLRDDAPRAAGDGGRVVRPGDAAR